MKKIMLTTIAVTALSLATPVIVQAQDPNAEASSDSKEGGMGFFFEPMVSWESGSGDVNYPGPVNNVEADTDGFGAGLRLGAHMGEWLFLAADGRYSFPSYSIGGFGDVDAEAWNVGATIGAQMPWILGLRAWGTYVFSGELDPDAQGALDANYEGGEGYRLGVGFKVAIASFNIEFQDLTYDEVNVNSGIFAGSNIGGVEQDQQTWIWSVSFPFSM